MRAAIDARITGPTVTDMLPDYAVAISGSKEATSSRSGRGKDICGAPAQPIARSTESRKQLISSTSLICAEAS